MHIGLPCEPLQPAMSTLEFPPDCKKSERLLKSKLKSKSAGTGLPILAALQLAMGQIEHMRNVPSAQHLLHPHP